MAHAIAFGLYKMRRDIGRIPFGVFKHHKKIGVTSLCDVEGGKDLVPVTIFDGHKMSVLDYAGILASKTVKAKGNKDKEEVSKLENEDVEEKKDVGGKQHLRHATQKRNKVKEVEKLEKEKGREGGK